VTFYNSKQHLHSNSNLTRDQ